MTLDEFQEKYCVLCGTQRCGGVYDEEFREGCEHYKEEYNLKSEENTEEHKAADIVRDLIAKGELPNTIFR